MNSKKVLMAVLMILVMAITFIAGNITTSAATGYAGYQTVTLKKGMSGASVKFLQNDLKKLGVFSVTPNGIYGNITKSSVKKLQSKHGLVADGIAGVKTFGLINKLLGRTKTTTSRSSTDRDKFLIPWFGNAEKIFAIGDIATVYDIGSGRSFKIKRTYGYNHADVEALDAMHGRIMKEIYGGKWSWTRRAVIIKVDGMKIPASMSGMPHAGNDAAPANKYTTWRSGNYGAGTNLDTIKNNGQDGHFDIHFLNSKTHATNKVDEAHQEQVQKAVTFAASHY